MVLEIKNGFFSYDKKTTVLNNINLYLKKNEILSILGQNGSGKTTMLKCILGLLKWNSGKTFINGISIKGFNRSNKIGYVPQIHNLTFPYTVKEIVLMGRAKYINLFSLPSKEDKIKAMEALKEVGIEHLAERSSFELSGGQLQLVFIARALVSDPKIIIFDEPESHLDLKNQRLIINLIKNLVVNKDISCIINTHHPEYALRISDKTLLLGKGEYIFGKSYNIITEDNMKKYFNIDIKIFSYTHNEKSLKSFILL